MSHRSEGDEDGGRSVLDILEDWYHVPVLLAVVVAMFALRMKTYDAFIRDGKVFFAGNDAWYHLRETLYVVKHWPTTMPFDPWTGFPYGNASGGQFGSLYDQLVATIALVLGLGNPSHELVAKVLLVAPAAAGALTAIPVYYLGKRLGNRVTGLVSAVILMLLPGLFLQRTLVGVSDHNGVEPLFQGLAVLGLLVAFAVAERETPVWELVVDRDFEGLRTPTKWAALAGVATGLYLWVWPPGVLLVGIVGVFLLLKETSAVLQGDTPEPVAYAAAVAMGVTALLALLRIESFDFSTTSISLLHLFSALAVGVAGAFLAWLARRWEQSDLDESLYPVAVAGIGVVGVAAVWVILPDVLHLVVNNLLRIVGFSATAQSRTVGEAQPFLSPSSLNRLQMDAVGRILNEYGFTFFSAVIAAGWMVAKPLVGSGDSRRLGYVGGSLVVVAAIFLFPVLGPVGGLVGLDQQLLGLLLVSALIAGAFLLGDHRADHVLALVWAAFITAAAFTQIRFNYYLAVVVASFNAYLLKELFVYLGLDAITLDSLTDVQGYQVLAVGAAVLLILAPALAVPISVRNTGNPSVDQSTPVWKAAQYNGPGDVMNWESSLRWMATETPAEGTQGGSNNALEYYGRYQRPPDSDFQYPQGAYGVQSWWDYGHWITVEGERIPNANPFQQGATSAANYLLAPNESSAAAVLQEQSTEGDRTRYVMVDWKMVTPTSKFTAPVVFYDRRGESLNQSDMFNPVYGPNFRQSFFVRDQRYYDSLMVRLYAYHGSAMDPKPYVVDWDERRVQTGDGRQLTVRTAPAGNQSLVRSFKNMSAAREYVRQDGSAQVGGIGQYPQERVPALRHYRLVKVSNSSGVTGRAFQQDLFSTARMTGMKPATLLQTNPNWLKTFERVPGATVHGSGAPPNANVTARVRMHVPTDNTTFVYTQHAQANADGEFTMTLPYSTTGYDEYGPDNGYTNVSVRAQGPYTIKTPTRLNESGYFVTHQDDLNVSEGRVNGDETGDLSVTLHRASAKLQLGSGNSSSEGSGTGNATASGSGSDTATGSGSGGSNSTSSGTQTAAIDAPAVRVAPT